MSRIKWSQGAKRKRRKLLFAKGDHKTIALVKWVKHDGISGYNLDKVKIL